VQVVSGRTFESHLEVQSYRTVRIPAVRGKILDGTGANVLAENRPRYNLCLNLDMMRPKFEVVFRRLKVQAQAIQKERVAREEQRLGRSLTKAERKQAAITAEEWDRLGQQARFEVARRWWRRSTDARARRSCWTRLKFERAYARGWPCRTPFCPT